MRKIMTTFLWSGTDEVQGGKCLLGGINLGGLGIVDLRHLGIALRLRWCWLARIDLSIPWASLLQPVDAKLAPLAVVSIQVRVGDGRLALFLWDAWIDGQSLQNLAPDLVATVPVRIQRSRTIA
jgi:hypothetical protein